MSGKSAGSGPGARSSRRQVAGPVRCRPAARRRPRPGAGAERAGEPQHAQAGQVELDPRQLLGHRLAVALEIRHGSASANGPGRAARSSPRTATNASRITCWKSHRVWSPSKRTASITRASVDEDQHDLAQLAAGGEAVVGRVRPRPGGTSRTRGRSGGRRPARAARGPPRPRPRRPSRAGCGRAAWIHRCGPGFVMSCDQVDLHAAPEPTPITTTRAPVARCGSTSVRLACPTSSSTTS